MGTGGRTWPGRVRRRQQITPRAEWQITRDTHTPLISDEDAEAILTQLQSGQGRRSRATDRVYLLSGILVDPTGQPYSGESYQGAAFYRLGKGAKVAATAVESTVLRLVLGEMCRPETAAAIAQRLRDSAPAKPKARDGRGAGFFMPAYQARISSARAWDSRPRDTR